MPTDRRDLSFLPPEVLKECGCLWDDFTGEWFWRDPTRLLDNATQADEDAAVGVMVRMLRDQFPNYWVDIENAPEGKLCEALAETLAAALKAVGEGE